MKRKKSKLLIGGGIITYSLLYFHSHIIMKPLTLVVDRNISLHEGDYLIIIDEETFIVATPKQVSKVIESNKADDKHDKPVRHRRVYRKNVRRPTAAELEARKGKLLDLVIKHPHKNAFWYRDKMGINATRFKYTLNDLIANKMVKCTYNKRGRFNPWQPISPT